MTQRVVVAGGGIGGLTVAVALARHGLRVDLLERGTVDGAGDTGAGIQISPNATRVLSRLGLGDALASVATETRAIEVRAHRSGTRVAEIALGAAARARYGAPYYHVLRRDLIAVLERGVATSNCVAVHPGAAVVEVRGDDAGATAICTDGREFHADVLIGADGIRSVARVHVDAGSEPRFAGMAAWRALIPGAELPEPFRRNVVGLWPGPGAHLVHYPVASGAFVNLVACVEQADWTDASWTMPGSRDELAATFAGWHGDLRPLLDAVDTPFVWALYEVLAPARWARGRVVLLGDACHAMLPFAAQGAAQAIEDAWVLADELGARPAGPDAALQAYQSRRQLRVRRVQQESRRRATLYHQRSALRRAASLLPVLLGGNAAGWNDDSQTWLYGHDVTTEN